MKQLEIQPPSSAIAGIEDVDFDKSGGLVPAIAQEAGSGRILMLAWVNREALDKSLSTGFAHYYSRSRRELWKKGASSGNLQKLEAIHLDCDGDSLLYLVRQSGPACHTGAESCFFRRFSLEA